MTRKIQIVEVGPRDGLQNEKAILEAADKAEFIRRLEACGVTRIEAVSFVNPKRVPQMAGAEEIMADLPRQAGRSRIGLVLNERGWDRALAAGVDEANVVVCATDGFGIRNQGASVAEQVAAMAAIANRRAAEGGPPISVTVSVAFGCPFDGDPILEPVRQKRARIRRTVPDFCPERGARWTRVHLPAPRVAVTCVRVVAVLGTSTRPTSVAFPSKLPTSPTSSSTTSSPSRSIPPFPPLTTASVAVCTRSPPSQQIC